MVKLYQYQLIFNSINLSVLYARYNLDQKHFRKTNWNNGATHANLFVRDGITERNLNSLGDPGARLNFLTVRQERVSCQKVFFRDMGAIYFA